MAPSASRFHHAAPWPSARRVSRWLPLARLLLLIALFLLPVQMRAGAADAHPHALLQLLLDARDGAVDHHDQQHPVSHAAPDDAARRDTSELGTSLLPGAAAILAAIVTTVSLPAAGSPTPPPVQTTWQGRRPILEPPPPRHASA